MLTYLISKQERVNVIGSKWMESLIGGKISPRNEWTCVRLTLPQWIWWHKWTLHCTHLVNTYQILLMNPCTYVGYMKSACHLSFPRVLWHLADLHKVTCTSLRYSADMKECLRLAERLADLSMTIFSSKKHVIERGLLVLHAVNDCLSPHFCLCDVTPTV